MTPTPGVPAVPVAVLVAGVPMVKVGRRESDWHVVARKGKSVFFWIFGMFLDERHKPSMSRIMLSVWTYVGGMMEWHEMKLKPLDVALSNASWTAWWAAEGVLALAVFGPSIASYFGAGAAGAMAGINASLRDAVQTVVTKVETATGDGPNPPVVQSASDREG